LQLPNKVKELLSLKSKFAVTSVIATSTDYLLFMGFIWLGWAHNWAFSAAYFLAVLLNYYLQKTYVFESKRSNQKTFWGAMLVSGSGLLIGHFIMTYLSGFAFFDAYPILAKLLITGLLFFYNFYAKRWVFEGKLV